MNQITFKTGFNKLVNGLPDLLPVSALILKHSLIDGKAAVHLKIEDSLRLLIGKEAVLH